MQAKFMRAAIRLAVTNAKDAGGPFGAVVVKDNRIVGRGQNSVYRRLDPSAHAEIMAIRDACRRLGVYHLHGCELYTSCEPCPMCLAASYWARIARIYHAATHQDAAAVGFDDAFMYAELARPAGERQLPLLRLLGEEGQAPFAAWAANPNRIPY